MFVRLKRTLYGHKKVNMFFFFFSLFLINTIALGYSALQQNLMITGEVNYVQLGNRLYDVLKNEALTGGLAAEYTGAHQDAVDGSGTKAIYHYYATTDEEGTSIQTKNNVLFGGYCWQMYRTTDMGGVRMIYNGKAVNNRCLDTRGSTNIGYKNAASWAVNTATVSGSYYYGTDYTYNSSTGFQLQGVISKETWSASGQAANVSGGVSPAFRIG